MDNSGAEKGSDPNAPLIWILLGHRAGDNLQVQALASALGWQACEKNLQWRTPLARWTPFYGRAATLKYLTPEAIASFAPPWPDLVLSIGWRSVPIARWIQQQCGVRLVHLGRPRAPLDGFDLILTTPQYRLPDMAHVVELTGPIATRFPDQLAAEAEIWEPKLSHLPRPWIAVMIGGDAKPLRFPPSDAMSLGRACNIMAADQGGSLLATTGPRTSDASANAFLDQISVPSHCHQWGDITDNPYAAFLALADRFVVTTDSVSMAHDVVQTGRALHIYPLGMTHRWLHEGLRKLDEKLRSNDTALARFYLWLIRVGVFFPPRSTADYFQTLIRQGRANELGAPEAHPFTAPIETDAQLAVAAIHRLFQKDGEHP